MDETNKNKINVSGILAQKAMIATLHTSCWSARITDKEATKELLENKKADKNAGSFSKALIDKKHLKKIREIMNTMKTYHKSNTLPWNNDGGRLLPSAKHSEYSAFLRGCQRDLETAVTEFVDEYSNYVADASFILNDLYNSDDYPSKYEIKNKFAIDADFDKVPEAADFRVDIPEYEQEKICRQIEERVETQHAESMKRVYRRIYKTIEHMHEKLSTENGIFRNSLVENIKDLVAVLPSLNILDDTVLTQMTDELSSEMCSIEVDDLRKDSTYRKEVAEKSKAFLDKIDGILGAVTVKNEPDKELPQAA